MIKNWSKLFLACAILIFGQNYSYAQKLTSSNGVRIAWDYSSMQQIAERGGYPRLTRLKDSSLIAIYETRTGNIHLKKSTDNGKTWSGPEEVFSKFVYASLDGKSTVVNIANPEIKQLQNGDIIIGCNYRPAKAEIAPYTIVVRRSKDNGKTWLAPQNLYTAAPRFTDGCWEPSFLQLPNGELQVYFANENPYRNSEEQEISMLSSNDNGATWTETAKTVSYRKDRRDGMPVAEIINDEIVVVIEDNKENRFKPYTVRTKITDNWSKPILANSAQRDYSLAKPVDDSVYMGAPYFLKLPNGETLISYQSNQNRKGDWEYSTMEVAIGDKTARNFDRLSQPFDVPLNKEAKWSSLALWDNNTVVAFASTNFKSKEVAPWLIKGHIIPQLSLKTKSDSHPIFIGAKGKTNLKANIIADKNNIVLEAIVNDIQKKDSSGVFFYLKLNEKLFKIRCMPAGEKQLWVFSNNTWKASELNNKIKFEPTSNINGYRLKLMIPKTLDQTKPLKELRLGIGLSAYDDNQNRYIEYLANMNKDLPASWLNIEI
jgi:hypothetical protein